MTFSEKLKMLREKAGLSKSKFASSVGIDRKTLIKYEKGESEPTIHIFEKICEVLQVDPKELLNDTTP